MLDRRFHLTALSALSLLAACGGGGPDSSTSSVTPPPPPPPSHDLEPEEVRVHTNLADPRLVTTLSSADELVEIFGVRNEAGQVVRTTRTVIRYPDGALANLEFDDQERLHRFEITGQGGMKLDYVDEDTGHVRFFDAQGTILDELWLDAHSGQEVDPPPPSSGVTFGGPAPTPPALSGNDGRFAAGWGDSMLVSIQLTDCDGQPSAQAAASVQSALVRLDAGVGVFDFPATRTPSGFEASLPRVLSEFDFQQEHCEAMLEWSEDLCFTLNEPNLSGLLLAACETPWIASNPYLFYLCVAANAGVAVYCGEAQRSAELACSGLVTLYNPWDSIWGGEIPQEREIRAMARVRTCNDIEERWSDPLMVTREDSSATLSVDGCLPDIEPSWTAWAAIEHAGVLHGDSAGGFQFLDPLNPSYGWQAVGFDPPPLGPDSDLEECFWPHPDDPIDIVEITETAAGQFTVATYSGAYQVDLSVTRDLINVRPPTQAEIDAGVPAGVDVCLQQPAEVSSAFGSLYTAYLKPFQNLVLRVNLQGGATSPEGTTTAGAQLLWPTDPGGALRQFEFTGDGEMELVVTHDEVRRAQDAWNQMVLDQLPPDVPLPPSLQPELGQQCYAIYFVILLETELVVDSAVTGSTSPQASYTFEVLHEESGS